MQRSLYGIAALATVLSFAPALADSSITVSGAAPTESGSYRVRAVQVSFADIDVGTVQGATTLLARIDAAAGAVCGERDAPMNARRAAVFKVCRTQTVAAAVQQMNTPRLTELAAAH